MTADIIDAFEVLSRCINGTETYFNVNASYPSYRKDLVGEFYF